MATKKTTLIRVGIDDKPIWDKYCKALGEKSPGLFKKVIRSQNINLNQKVLEELQKREAELKKKLNII